MSVTADGTVEADGTFTVQDLLDAPDDGRKYEILEGALVVSPWPRYRHQAWVARAMDALRPGAPAGYLVLPGGNVAAGNSVPVPDMVVVHDRVLREDIVSAIPADVPVVVEVLGPGQEGRDRLLKRSIYARMGIRAYWIVDPAAESVTVLRLAGEEYNETYVGPDLDAAAAVTWGSVGRP